MGNILSMKKIYLLFYFLTNPFCLAAEYQPFLDEDHKVLHLSSGLVLEEINPDDFIVEESNAAIQRIVQDILTLQELVEGFGEVVGDQGKTLNEIGENLNTTEAKLKQADENLHQLLKEKPDATRQEKPELAFLPETEEQLNIQDGQLTAQQPTPTISPIKENTLAAGIGATGGLVALGAAYVAAAPAAIIITAATTTGLLGFGATKLHFNKDSLPSLPSLPSIPSLPHLPSLAIPKPSLPYLPSLPSWVPLLGDTETPSNRTKDESTH